MSRKDINRIIAGFVVLVLVVLVVRSRLKALPTISPVQSLLLPSALNIDVTENGQPGLGLLYVGKSCSKNPLTSQGGNFHCALSAQNSSNTYGVKSLTYQSFTSQKVYTLPVSPPTGEPAGFSVRSGKNLSLILTVANGQLQTQELVGNNYVVVNPAIGLQ